MQVRFGTEIPSYKNAERIAYSRADVRRALPTSQADTRVLICSKTVHYLPICLFTGILGRVDGYGHFAPNYLLSG